MRKLDRYLLLSYIGPMILTFCIVLFVLLLQFMWVYIDELIGKGLSFGVICEFFFWGMAQFVPLALPLSTMLASIMTMGGLGENNELLAMKAAGIPLQRIQRPLMILVIFISAGAFFAANNLIPFANLQIKTILFDIKQKRAEIKIPSGVFYDGIEDISLYVSQQDEHTGLMRDIMFYDHRNKKGNTNVTLAESGYIQLTKNKQHIVFTLYNGETYEDGETKSSADTTRPFQRRKFTEQVVLVPLEGYDFKRSDGERFKEDAMTLNIRDLTYLEDSLNQLISENRTNFMQTFALSGDMPRSFEADSINRNRYVHMLSFDSLFHALTPERQLETADKAKSRVTNSLAQVIGYVGQQEKDDYPRRKMKIEWNRKFALSFACLIFFFIGAPLGAIIRKGGLGMPTVVSIFFFIIYWVIDITGQRLARDGAWSPNFGTWISTVVLLPIGIFLIYKATTDSALFNAEKYIAFFRAIFRPKKRDASIESTYELPPLTLAALAQKELFNRLLRQLTDLQAQAGKIIAGEKSDAQLENFATYAADIKDYILTHIPNESITSYVSKIPKIHVRVKATGWRHFIVPSWYNAIAKKKTLAEIKAVQEKYAALETAIKELISQETEQ